MSKINQHIGPDRLRKFFIEHLNHVYNAKACLALRIPRLKILANFKDLKNAIAGTGNTIQKQIARMREIFSLLNTKVSVEKDNKLTGVIEDAFTVIEQNDDRALSDMSILFFLQNILGAGMTSLQILQLAAVKLKNKQIKQLLKENFEEAKSEKIFFQLLTAKYITG